MGGNNTSLKSEIKDTDPAALDRCYSWFELRLQTGWLLAYRGQRHVFHNEDKDMLINWWIDLAKAKMPTETATEAATDPTLRRRPHPNSGTMETR